MDPGADHPGRTLFWPTPILLLKEGVPGASVVAANPSKTDLPVPCAVYALTGLHHRRHQRRVPGDLRGTDF